jgi:hypothetical protein
MQTQRIVETAPGPESMPVMTAAVPQRSERRATARRASSRRAQARQHKGQIDGRILQYVKGHPQSTTGDIAKGLNVNRDMIAAEVSHMMRAGEITKDCGHLAIPTTRPAIG